MTPAEASDLLARCTAFDNRKPSLIAAQGWASALEDVPLDDDTFAAVDRFYGTPPKTPGDRLWIQPHDVRTHRKTIRAERLENFVYEPPSGDRDPYYLTRYRRQLDAIGSGQQAAPSNAPALEGGPHPSLAELLDGTFQYVPGEDAAVAQVRRAGPLGVVCPKCQAVMGRPCRTPAGKERPAHPARSLASRGEAVEDPTTEREVERRRAASRAHLAALPPDAKPEPRDGFTPTYPKEA